VFLTFLLAASPAGAADYHVAPDGNDDDAGTQAAPFKTVGKGQQMAAAGDTVWVHGGIYMITAGTVGVAFSKAGTAGNPIRYFAYAGETPVFDLSAVNPTGRVTGFDVHTSYVHIRGMEITGVPQYQSGQDSWGLRIQGNNNIIEQVNVHHNEAPGIFITSGSDNLVLNCDSHHNYDVLEDGGSGDGFGCHSTGAGNVLRGCRAWSNSDDGYDFINAPGACTVEHSWSWRNGWVPDTTTGAGNGAGFKVGGFGLDSSTFPAVPPVHVVQQCVAWDNRSQGFYANHHPGTIHFYNNTAYNNPKNFDLLDDVVAATHVLRNNVVFGTGSAVANESDDDIASNSWNGAVSLGDDDFLSLEEGEASGPRAMDGSLPSIAFLHLQGGSDCVDAGQDVGLPFSGAAPDLGAFEIALDDAPDDMVTSDTSNATAPSETETTRGSSSVPAPSNQPSTTASVPSDENDTSMPSQSGPGSTSSAAPRTSDDSVVSTTSPVAAVPSRDSPASEPPAPLETSASSSDERSGIGDARRGNSGCGCVLGGATSQLAGRWFVAVTGLLLTFRRMRQKQRRSLCVESAVTQTFG
jgi:hypothetical protein